MRIGELAKLANCTTETIRFYEKEALLPPRSETAQTTVVTPVATSTAFVLSGIVARWT